MKSDPRIRKPHVCVFFRLKWCKISIARVLPHKAPMDVDSMI